MRGTSSPNDRALVVRELLRLDPWAFWTVELDDDAVPFAVVGRTGAFAIGVCPLEGYLVAEGRHLTVEGVRVGGWRALRAATKTLRSGLSRSGAPSAPVVPILVLARAIAGGPREHRGTRVLRPADLVTDIVERPHVLDPGTAQGVASGLGRVLRSAGEPGTDAEGDV